MGSGQASWANMMSPKGKLAALCPTWPKSKQRRTTNPLPNVVSSNVAITHISINIGTLLLKYKNITIVNDIGVVLQIVALL